MSSDQCFGLHYTDVMGDFSSIVFQWFTRRVIVFLFALQGFVHAGPIEVTQQEYENIKALAARITKDYPTDRYWYLMWGRSPTPLTAYFENLGFQNITAIPVGSDIPLAKKNSEILDLTQDVLKSHLPSQKDLNGRSFLVLDYVNTGASLDTARKSLTEYYRDLQGKTPRVRVKGFHKNFFYPALGGYALQVSTYQIAESLDRAFDEKLFKDAAKFEPFESDPKNIRAAYRDYKSALKQLMDQDPKVREGLLPKKSCIRLIQDFFTK